MKIYSFTIILLFVFSASAQITTFNRTQINLPKPARSIAVGDLNNDGNKDIVVARNPDNANISGNISILLGNGNGSFQTERTINVGNLNSATDITAYISDVEIADLNNDYSQDIIILHQFRDSTIYPLIQASGISILYNNGSNNFTETLYNTYFPPYPEINYRHTTSLAIIDFNNDGKKDIFLGGIEDEGFLIGLRNNGNNNLEQVYYTRTAGVTDLSFGKFNQDNQLDLVFSSARGNIILFGTNNFSLTGYANKDFNVYQTAMTVGDFNADGLDDYAVWSHEKKELRIFVNSLNGLPNLPRIYKLKTKDYQPFTSLINGDFNGDGKLDIAITFYDEKRIRILYGLGSGAFARGDIFQVGKYPHSLASADFNNDGKLDLAVTNYQDSPNEQLDVLINTTPNNKQSN